MYTSRDIEQAVIFVHDVIDNTVYAPTGVPFDYVVFQDSDSEITVGTKLVYDDEPDGELVVVLKDGDRELTSLIYPPSQDDV